MRLDRFLWHAPLKIACEFSIPLKLHNVSTGHCMKIRALPLPNDPLKLWTVVLFPPKSLSQNHLAAPKYPRLPYNFC